MPYAPGTIRFNVRGNMIGGEQIVNTLHGVAVGGTVPDGESATLQAMVDNLRDQWAALFRSSATLNGLNLHLAQGTTYNAVDGYTINPLGRATGQATATFAGGEVGGAAANALPNEVAMAVSLFSDRAGRTGRGRLYLGGLSVATINAQGPFRPEVTGEIAQRFRDMIQALNNTAGPGFDWVIASRVAGVSSNVTEVRVGDVPDVQRRRRNRLRETYATARVTS